MAETDKLVSEIEETRADMSETLEAIQERLRPGRVISDAGERVKETVIGVATWLSEARFAVIEAIRRNPVPAALVSLGATLVLCRGLRRRIRT